MSIYSSSHWAAYRVTRASIGTTKGYKRQWIKDPLLDPKDRLVKEDFRGVSEPDKYSRGHVVPLASFAGTEYWRETFYLSNATPQKSALNNGVWNKLENRIRKMAYELDGVNVLTGTLYERSLNPLPNSNTAHIVPSGYWKVVVKNNKAIGFLMDQDIPSKGEVCVAIVELSEIEKRAGLELFPAGNLVGNLERSKVGC
uniref:Endonuclease n=1 Tax=OCS116 cluster bacterium TaxID=2030921 RepID=A0A2A4YS93_9PROT